MAVSSLYLILVFLIASLTETAPSTLPCMAMCSKGHTQTFVGDIRNSSNLTRMLKDVSFKGEIMFAASGWWSGEAASGHDLYQRIGHLDMALQLYDELYDMGYAHFILVSHSSRMCEAIKPIRPLLSCVWDSLDLSKAKLGLLHHKMMFIARAVRSGYNVMALDADVIFFQDPYHTIKSTPLLLDSHFICIPEGGSPYNCNAGFMYTQNADPSGPVAWVWFDIIRTILQRVDDEGHNSFWCTPYDQLLIMDSLTSAAAGLPYHLGTLESCHNDPARANTVFNASNGQKLTLFDVVKNMKAMMVNRGIRTNIQPTKEWMEEFTVTSLKKLDYDFLAFSGNLTVPNQRFSLPELGGPDSQRPVGPLASLWLKTLHDDNPSAPWFAEDVPLSEEDEKKLNIIFPDPKDHSRMAHVASLPHNLFYPTSRGDRNTTEIFTHAPQWLAASIQASPKGLHLGKEVKDGPKKLRGPYLSIGHIHGLAGGPDKLIYRKILARYNWTLGSEIARVISPHSSPTWSPYVLGAHFHKVIALHPNIDLSRTRNSTEFSSLIYGLALVARLSRRVLVLPTLPCEAKWLDKGGSKSCEPPIPFSWKPDNPIFFPVDGEGTILGGWARRRRRRALETSDDHATKISDPWWANQKYRAIPGGFTRACAVDIHAIIAPEYQHWLKSTDVGRNVSKIKPESSNIAFIASQDLGIQSDPASHGWSLADLQASIPVTDATRELNRFKSQPIVFISHPIMIREASEVKEEDMIRVNSTALNPNSVLSHLNHKFKSSQCQWLKKKINEYPTELLDEKHIGIKCKIDRNSNKIVK